MAGRQSAEAAVLPEVVLPPLSATFLATGAAAERSHSWFLPFPRLSPSPAGRTECEAWRRPMGCPRSWHEALGAGRGPRDLERCFARSGSLQSQPRPELRPGLVRSLAAPRG